MIRDDGYVVLSPEVKNPICRETKLSLESCLYKPAEVLKIADQIKYTDAEGFGVSHSAMGSQRLEGDLIDYRD